LKQGDSLYVEDRKGVTTTFVVRECRTYNEDDDTSSVFSSGDGKAHLNLITCAGNFNKISESYSERLVIFADKE
jgi:sortase (surface protein transpeptidase)